jgi:hypothetical protein
VPGVAGVGHADRLPLVVDVVRQDQDLGVAVLEIALVVVFLERAEPPAEGDVGRRREVLAANDDDKVIEQRAPDDRKSGLVDGARQIGADDLGGIAALLGSLRRQSRRVA